MSTPLLSETLHHLTHAYKRRLREGVRQAGIDLPITHIRVLKGVTYDAGATAQSIANRMQRDKAQITRVIRDLLEDGLILRQPHPEDRRSQLLRPSTEAQALMTRLQALEARTVQEMTHNLNAQELERFTELANLMAGNVSAASDNTKGETEHE